MQKNKEKSAGANPFPKLEEEVLDFWDRAKIFDKSVNKNAPRGDYVFYDGPPFATGLPHYGHIVASVMKDAVPRYWTMRGCRVKRKWGWDCHGLPIENLAEKELGLENKQDIEKLGVEKFNDYCRGLVLRYADDWKRIIKRIGRWVDMENDYKTMDTDYVESVWWAFKELWSRGLAYQGYKSMHICPRCGTTLSNFEVGLGYKSIKDLAATIKFKAKHISAVHAKLRPDAKAYFLAWTTTPWTLAGNAALAVGSEIDYAIVMAALPDNQGEKLGNLEIPREKVHEEFYILAKDKIRDVLDQKVGFEIIGEVKGRDLAGSEYEPIFDYYHNERTENRENGWKVYAADFVTTDEGTGIVHIAPAFGEDDMKLGKEKNLPFIQHIDPYGRFKDEAKDFAGIQAKPRENPQSADIEIIKHLANKRLLFSKEKIEHSYPHCWRCETPLLNYAAQSWFVQVTKVKEALVGNNQKVNWIPSHLKEGRFGKWLENARDWSISRNRYWGDPLPVWKCDSCDETKVLGSIDELNEATGKLTKIIIMRHGESAKNVIGIYNCTRDGSPLTDRGKQQAEKAVELFATEKITAIYSSPVERARETADIIGKKLNIKFRESEELREVNSGSWEGLSSDDPSLKTERSIYSGLPREENYHTKRGGTGESWQDVEGRALDFVNSILKENKGKTILAVTHGGVIIYLLKALKSLSLEKTVRLFDLPEFKEYALPFAVYIDSDTGKQVDLHKQFVDKIEFDCTKCSGKMKRIPEVLDCWFESGSMPYAQMHYPFENKEKFANTFPAQFIAEGIDQTRGWFYTLLVLSTGLFGKPAFNNVIVNGIILAEDGQKMSKSKGNFPDPALVFEKYGVDAMRYYLLSSPVLSGENLNFSEKGVEEVLRKVSMILWNVYKFFEIFNNNSRFKIQDSRPTSSNILDLWILARLDQLIDEATDNMEKYLIPKAIRPIADFINDLSTWYLRRSRDRLKATSAEASGDKTAALQTMKFVLVELSKVMAPFMPFLAEQIWQKATGYDFEDKDKSVHLEEWPNWRNAERAPRNVIKEMEITRRIVEAALAKRDEAGIKVRQPLASLKIKLKKPAGSDAEALQAKIGGGHIDLIKDEVNVKEVIMADDDGLDGDNEIAVLFDFMITPELKREGVRREIVRWVNSMRKDAGMTVSDKIILFWSSDGEEIKRAIHDAEAAIGRDTLASGISETRSREAEVEKTCFLETNELWLGIKKS